MNGFVSLVGAGPGDPALLTRRAARCLRGADLVLYDALVDARVLRLARRAQRFFVGKRAGRHSMTQEAISALMVRAARRGKRVVRLKGGDPFVFGRGGEEAEALSNAGVAFEVVPGVSSAVAVPAYAGIPLTHRNFASSFAVVTGHEARKAHSAVDWSRVATAVDTLVILMGLANLPFIVEKLIAHGRSPRTPVAVIRSGTTCEQEGVVGTLADIVEKSALIEAPALIVVGDVVSLADKLNWFHPVLFNAPFYDFNPASESARA
jgi:uroporphyrinogen III methyltransferase / synthase